MYPDGDPSETEEADSSRAHTLPPGLSCPSGIGQERGPIEKEGWPAIETDVARIRRDGQMLDVGAIVVA